MSLRHNKALLAGMGICGMLLLAETGLLAVQAVQLGRDRRGLKSVCRQLARLHGRDPFPSADNVAAIRKNLEKLEYETGELAAVLGRDPFPRDAVEAADFSARAQDVIERFRRRAEAAGVVLPDTLEVGFAQYASGGAVPGAQYVPRLSRQLFSVERVADVLVECGVGSIDNLTRDMFETETVVAPEEQPGRRRPHRAPQVSSPRMRPILVASEIHPGNHYLIERVGVAFTAPEAVVWRVLNRFADAPHFMVVSEVSHTTQTDILEYNPERVKRGGEADDDTLRYLSEGILVGKKALSRPERIIAGNEHVNVRMVVEVYNFETAEGLQ
jgi:hypothetical protein